MSMGHAACDGGWACRVVSMTMSALRTLKYEKDLCVPDDSRLLASFSISVGIIILSRGASPFMNMIHAYATRVDRHALPLPRVPFAFIDHPFHSSKEMLFSTVKTALAMEPP